MGSVSIVGRVVGGPGRAAAVELILQDDRRGFPVDPGAVGVALRAGTAARRSGRGGIGPSRVSATWLVSRSSWNPIRTRSPRCAASSSTQARVAAACGPS